MRETDEVRDLAHELGYDKLLKVRTKDGRTVYQADVSGRIGIPIFLYFDGFGAVVADHDETMDILDRMEG